MKTLYLISTMQKVLCKITSSENAGSFIKFFEQADIRAEVEDFKKNPEVVRDFDYCVIFINFENLSELQDAEKFVQLNKHLKFCAYVNEGSKDAIINAHRLGCSKFVSRMDDLSELFNTPHGILHTNVSKNQKAYKEFKGYKVLLVDDMQVNLDLLAEILSPFEFELSLYTDSPAAAEMIETTRYDLILTDAMMPKLNGFELGRIAKASEYNSSTPIAFISGYSQAENKIESYNIGSAAFIEKPLEPAVVRAQIHSILKINSLQTEIMKQKENFIAMLTHDLKTPIRAQISALNLLLENNFGELSQDQREIANEIMASNKYMQNMTDNVLLNYKSENGKLQIKKSKNNIKDTIESALKKLKYVVSQKNQTIKVHYDLAVDFAYYDEIEIERVLTNLVVNAVEYSPENTQIGIYVSNDGERISVSVEDSGCGIAEDELNNILNKYVSKAKDYKKIGTGLGLYICKKIISGHGGDISVKKLQGAGSRFTFTLSNKEKVSISQ